MSINLSKGENHVLDKNTQTALVGLGWDAKSIYFNNKKHSSGAIVHSGDNLTGAGDGDDETIKLDFSKMPANIERLVVVVNIYKADERNQNFGQVNNAYVRLVETTGGKNEEQLRFDLTEDYSGSTGIRMADIYRHNGEWKMKAVGEGAKCGLGDFINQFK